MQGIYTDDGALDYAAAAAQLSTLRGLNNATLKADAVALVNAAALLDIAVSLNALVTMAGKEFDLGLDDGVVDDQADPGEERPEGDPPVDEQEADPFVINDWVVAAPGTAAWRETNGEPRRVLQLGETEGADWLVYETPTGGPSPRYWASNFALSKAQAHAAIDDEPETEPTECGEAFTSLDGGAALCERKPGHKGEHKVKRGNS